jgi:hypothetical protein
MINDRMLLSAWSAGEPLPPGLAAFIAAHQNKFALQNTSRMFVPG